LRNARLLVVAVRWSGKCYSLSDRSEIHNEKAQEERKSCFHRICFEGDFIDSNI